MENSVSSDSRKQLFTNEFEKRLIRLNESIVRYFETGREYNLLPSLASVFRLLWCSNRFRLKKPRFSSPCFFYRIRSHSH